MNVNVFNDLIILCKFKCKIELALMLSIRVSEFELFLEIFRLISFRLYVSRSRLSAGHSL